MDLPKKIETNLKSIIVNATKTAKDAAANDKDYIVSQDWLMLAQKAIELRNLIKHDD